MSRFIETRSLREVRRASSWPPRLFTVRFNPPPIEADIERIEAMGVRCITGDFASEGNVVRHDAERVTETLLSLGLSTLRPSQ